MPDFRLTLIVIASNLVLAACGPLPAPSAPSDTVAPTLAEVTAVPNSPYMNPTPAYTFSSTEAGTLNVGGGCSSAITLASGGNNTISLSVLAVGYYKNCTITVTDAAGNTSAALTMTPFIVGKPYNDTGITQCGDMAYSYTGYTGSKTHNNDVDCANGASPSSTRTQQGFEIANGLDAVPAGQDALFGRDTDATKNSDADGHKGFSYTKLSVVNGVALAIQNGNWSDAGSEAAGTQWGCVQDNVTGLMWEIKTNDSGLRDKDWTYTWYNSTNTNDGGDHGIGDTGVGTSTGYETSASIEAGSDNCFNTSRCDTEKYVADVNAGSGLCGKTDWRLPTVDELVTLADNDSKNLQINAIYIPNMQNSDNWSASPYAGYQEYAWHVNFNNGSAWHYNKSYGRNVQLVRSGK